jgi:hypothetical protein
VRLDCDVIKDLYPLYDENELSQKVRTAVDTHLLECHDCRNIYSSETGFKELLDCSMEMNEPTPTLDDKIILRLKLRRMAIIVSVLLTIIIVSIVKDYMANRERIADAYDGIYQLSSLYTEMVSGIKGNNVDNYDYYRNQLFSLFEEKQNFEENLNYFERMALKDSRYWLHLKQDQFIDMLTILHSRYIHDDWTETDQNALTQLIEYFEDHHELVQAEYDKFHHGYSSYLELVDTEELAGFYEKVNDLTYFYTRFHELPEDMVKLEENELTSILQTAFTMKNGEATFEEISPLNEPVGVYYFTVTDKENTFSGEIDGFTGHIIDADQSSHSLTDGELLDESEVNEKALNFLEKLYGEGNVDVKSEGTNFNISSNDDDFKMYSFSFIPKASGYELYIPYETKFTIHFDARTGELFSFNSPSFLSADFFTIKPELKINKEQATVLIEKEEVDSLYTHQDLGIIKSMSSGEFVLVYIFKNREGLEDLYINTESGIIEKPYLSLR